MSINRIHHLLDPLPRDARRLLRNLFAVRAVADRFELVLAEVAPEAAVLLAIDYTDPVGQAILEWGRHAGVITPQSETAMRQFCDTHGLGALFVTVVDAECAATLWADSAEDKENARASFQRCLSHGTRQLAVAWTHGTACVAALQSGGAT